MAIESKLRLFQLPSERDQSLQSWDGSIDASASEKDPGHGLSANNSQEELKDIME